MPSQFHQRDRTIARISESAGMTIEPGFEAFVREELLPGTNVNPHVFWRALGDLIEQFSERNAELLTIRHELQEAIDQFHRDHPNGVSASAYCEFLTRIGYLDQDRTIAPIRNGAMHPEVSTIAGPQLVAPLSSTRFVVNASNARWGSLCAALDNSDVLPHEQTKYPGTVNSLERQQKLFSFCQDFLDKHAPLACASYASVKDLSIRDGDLIAEVGEGTSCGLVDHAQFIGYRGSADRPSSILLRNNELHIELMFEGDGRFGRKFANLTDLILESAVTTIFDMEDSVAAVDSEEKVAVYRNLIALMKGDTSSARTGAKAVGKQFAANRDYIGRDGAPLKLAGRSVTLIRNVGLLMTTPMVSDRQGQPVPEGILDALTTAVASLHEKRSTVAPSRDHGSNIYIVKPKLHGADEVRFTVELFEAIEAALGLTAGAIKIGLMDEERRTSVNLARCIEAAGDRLFFINTGFLDRTGDEIFTSRLAGGMKDSEQMKSADWYLAYERQNVELGIASGLGSNGQIGKGMWTQTDEMRSLLETKVLQLRDGASTAWVPSPLAATLHALHYHQESPALSQEHIADSARDRLDDLLAIPTQEDRPDPKVIAKGLDQNIQRMLGYVSRWVDHGIGCSKVPDLDGVKLMEDRATLRISSQLLSNWLLHGFCSRTDVERSMVRMAAVVDAQNRDVPGYVPFGPTPSPSSSNAYAAVHDLIFEGGQQPSGYTEPLLYKYRQKEKAAQQVSN